MHAVWRLIFQPLNTFFPLPLFLGIFNLKKKEASTTCGNLVKQINTKQINIIVISLQLDPDASKLFFDITVVIIIAKNSLGLAHATCSKSLILLNTLISYTIPKDRTV